jgi:hypothetical protein
VIAKKEPHRQQLQREDRFPGVHIEVEPHRQQLEDELIFPAGYGYQTRADGVGRLSLVVDAQQVTPPQVGNSRNA